MLHTVGQAIVPELLHEFTGQIHVENVGVNVPQQRQTEVEVTSRVIIDREGPIHVIHSSVRIYMPKPTPNG